ncbi:MAG: hypothetical protein K6G88_05090 [Lachnospiraceae bacterium]|nr:hypothetical protein [Lachnospiraceae bacterium]
MIIKKIRKNEKGAVMVLFALLVVVLLGFAALTIDIGIKYINETKAQQVCDAAALAAAGFLPDKVKAEEAAKHYIEENGLEWDKVSISFFNADKTVSVEYKSSINTTFANVLGINSLNVNKSAVAQAGEGGPSSDDFDYAIFSGNDTANLNFGWGRYYAEGKVHSNGTMSCSTYCQATSYTANKKGGTFDPYNMYYLNKKADGTFEVGQKYSDDAPKSSDLVDMPYYLGDNMMDKLPKSFGMPLESYWDETITASDLSLYNDDGKAFQKKIGTGSNIHLNKLGTNGWFNYDLNVEGDLFLDCETGVRFQPANECNGVINGNIYIKNGDGKGSVDLFFNPVSSWGAKKPAVINGNIYCYGDLVLGNVEVNGNIYCSGHLSTDGGTNTKINCEYIYAGSVEIKNDVQVSGIIIAEHDIVFKGGTHDLASGETLSIYSKSGNIDFGGTNSNVNGIIFAPYGTCKAVGNCEVHGRIIGDKVDLFSGNINVYVPPADLGFDTTDPNPKPSGSGKAVLVQ